VTSTFIEAIKSAFEWPEVGERKAKVVLLIEKYLSEMGSGSKPFLISRFGGSEPAELLVHLFNKSAKVFPAIYIVNIDSRYVITQNGQLLFNNVTISNNKFGAIPPVAGWRRCPYSKSNSGNWKVPLLDGASLEMPAGTVPPTDTQVKTHLRLTDQLALRIPQRIILHSTSINVETGLSGDSLLVPTKQKDLHFQQLVTMDGPIDVWGENVLTDTTRTNELGLDNDNDEFPKAVRVIEVGAVRTRLIETSRLDSIEHFRCYYSNKDWLECGDVKCPGKWEYRVPPELESNKPQADWLVNNGMEFFNAKRTGSMMDNMTTAKGVRLGFVAFFRPKTIGFGTTPQAKLQQVIEKASSLKRMLTGTPGQLGMSMVFHGTELKHVPQIFVNMETQGNSTHGTMHGNGVYFSIFPYINYTVGASNKLVYAKAFKVGRHSYYAVVVAAALCRPSKTTDEHKSNINPVQEQHMTGGNVGDDDGATGGRRPYPLRVANRELVFFGTYAHQFVAILGVAILTAP
jgi:hypothetical protein